MCTLVILRRPDHEWPLLVAGNRDEMGDRPSSPPGRHWPERLDVVAGLDHLAGGSWLGINDHGVVAAVMNREGTLGPALDKRSRGELVLEALDHCDADAAALALGHLDPAAYRSFNLFVGDAGSAYWIRLDVEGAGSDVEVHPVPAGVHVLSTRELDDESLVRIRTFLPRFRAVGVPCVETGDWADWIDLLAVRGYSEQHGPYAAMNLDLPNGFGTRSSHLIAVPRSRAKAAPVFLYADGAPDRVPFTAITI